MKLLIALALAGAAAAFSPIHSGDRILSSYYPITTTALHANNNDEFSLSKSNNSRRAFLSTLPCFIIPNLANAAAIPVQQAVGSAESKCREEGNCLEKFELDGGTSFVCCVCIIPYLSWMIWTCTLSNLILFFIWSCWLELGWYRTMWCKRTIMRTWRKITWRGTLGSTSPLEGW